jgi:hypothetical protein
MLPARLWGKGTPRGWQGYSADTVLALLRLCMLVLTHASDTIASVRANARLTD